MSVWIGTSHFESKNAPHGLVQGNTVNSKSAVLALIAYSFFSNSILLFFDRGTELLPFVQRFLSGMAFSIYEVVQMACQSCSWFVYVWGINKPTTWLARKKPLLPGTELSENPSPEIPTLFWITLRQNQSGNWLMSIFSGQKPCTRII